MLAAADAGIVALEIRLVVGLIGGDRLPCLLRPFAEPVLLGRGQSHAEALDMDHVFRRRIAAAHQALDIFGVAEVEYLLARTVFQDEAPRGAFDTGVDRQRAAQNRSDIRGGGKGSGNGDALEGLQPASGQVPLGLVDFGYHVLIGLTRVIRPGEDAVLQQDHAVALRICLEGGVTAFARSKPGIT